MPQPVFRFAPSPTGLLHLGHALSAILNFEAARAAGGRFLLRIENTDAERCRDAFEAAIYDDLAWLGLTWERPVRRQSEHLALYRDALGRLDREGLLYPSFESRAELAALAAERNWPRDPDGGPLYSGPAKLLARSERARRMASGASYAMRIDMAAALRRIGPLDWREDGEGPGGERGAVTARPQAWGDIVVARKERPASYHLAVVVDDALQGVTDVVRGQDLFHATSIHRVLQALLGLPAPVYRHHRLILDAAGRKLSKSDGSQSLRELRAAGATPADIRRRIGL